MAMKRNVMEITGHRVAGYYRSDSVAAQEGGHSWETAWFLCVPTETVIAGTGLVVVVTHSSQSPETVSDRYGDCMNERVLGGNLEVLTCETSSTVM